MQKPPPMGLSQKDVDHLKLLSIFHYVVAGFALVGGGFLVLHYLIMSRIFENPGLWANSKEGPPPAELFEAFKVFYLFAGGVLLVVCVLNCCSAVFLRQRRNRMFSLVVAGINCLQIPIGTTLGVLTILVLVRDSVRIYYAERRE